MYAVYNTSTTLNNLPETITQINKTTELDIYFNNNYLKCIKLEIKCIFYQYN